MSVKQASKDEEFALFSNWAMERNAQFFVSLSGRNRRVVMMCLACGLSLFLLLCVGLFGGGDNPMVEFSAAYFCCCFLGGVVSGLPHILLTPVDLIKCRIQVGEYDSMMDGFRSIFRDSGSSFISSIPFFYRGWVPILFGYSLQGGTKFFLYEVFKYLFQGQGATQAAYSSSTKGSNGAYQMSTFIVAGFLAEMIADILLAPWEAVKIKIQTTSVHRTEVGVIIPMVWAAEGCRGFYKGIVPLWCRQVPYTVVKFVSFESIAHQLYKVFGSVPVNTTPKSVQIFVSLLSGLLAGIVCAIISHPADTIVSKLNQRTGTGHGDTRNTCCHVLRDTGGKGLWKGIGPRVLMVGTLSGLQWVLYDSFKVFVGFPTTAGGHVESTGPSSVSTRG